MQISPLNCPSCGAPAPQNITAKQPFQCAACGSTLIMMPSEPSGSGQIICPQCQTPHTGMYKFCTKCGMKLAVDCPACFHPNEIGASVCAKCGGSIRDAIQRRESWKAEKRRYDEDRLASWQQGEDDRQQADIQRLLDDLDDPEKHPFTIFCLHERGSQAVGPLIETLCTDNDVDARYGAARVLGMIGDPQAIPALMRALADPEPAVRYWAVDALGNLRAQDAERAILKLKRDPSPGVRERVELALQQIRL
jgi:hypothetical protein